jgi:CarD family transcriptional regulator
LAPVTLYHARREFFRRTIGSKGFMELIIGQKVAYPGQGVCEVEKLETRDVGGHSVECCLLRVVGDNSHILVPVSNAKAVGIRSVITTSQCRRLIDRLADDFEEISADWKTRSKQFTEKLQSGDVFEAADVLKKLTYLSHGKKLSFREQTLLEKAKHLLISEISSANAAKFDGIESRICALVESACSKHELAHPAMAATAGAH